MFRLWDERPPTSVVRNAQWMQLRVSCAPTASIIATLREENHELQRQSPDLESADLAVGKTGRQTRAGAFQDGPSPEPGAQGRRGVGAPALYFAGCRQPGLDARRDLSRGGPGQYRAGRRRHRRGAVLESA